MTTERPMFPPHAESANSLLPQPTIEHRSVEKPTSESRRPADGLSSLRLVGPEREMVAALLGFVACGLAYGSTLDQMEAIALDELERARKAAAKKQRYRWIVAPTAAEKAARASSPAAAAVRS